MAWFRNHYHCPDCENSWSDEWSCCCDDECSGCGKDFTPERSEDLHVVHRPGSHRFPWSFRVLISPPTAEHHPDYRHILTTHKGERHAKLIAETLNTHLDLEEFFK